MFPSSIPLHAITITAFITGLLLSGTTLARTVSTTDKSTSLALSSMELKLSNSSHANTTIHSWSCPNDSVLEPTIGDAVLPCHCYNWGRGHDRYWVVLAIDAFCHNYHVWSAEGIDELQQVSQAFWYNADNTVEGIRTILIKQDFFANEMGEQAQCDAEFVIDYDTCRKSMRVPLDGCNTQGENGKYGGQATSACLLWTVDGDPDLNDPEIYASLTTPSAVWPTPTAKA